MSRISILLTAQHRGDLRYLPRLASRLKALRQGASSLLIDSGGAWSAEDALCQITENRAPYLAMDAMGYNLIFADGLSPQNRERLLAMMQARLQPQHESATLILPEGQALQVRADAALSQPHFDGDMLHLHQPPTGTIQPITLDLESGQLSLDDLISVGMKPLPDPTISAVVEFIASEARYYQKKKGDSA